MVSFSGSWKSLFAQTAYFWMAAPFTLIVLLQEGAGDSLGGGAGGVERVVGGSGGCVGAAGGRALRVLAG